MEFEKKAPISTLNERTSSYGGRYTLDDSDSVALTVGTYYQRRTMPLCKLSHQSARVMLMMINIEIVKQPLIMMH